MGREALRASPVRTKATSQDAGPSLLPPDSGLKSTRRLWGFASLSYVWTSCAPCSLRCGEAPGSVATQCLSWCRCALPPRPPSAPWSEVGDHCPPRRPSSPSVILSVATNRRESSGLCGAVCARGGGMRGSKLGELEGYWTQERPRSPAPPFARKGRRGKGAEARVPGTRWSVPVLRSRAAEAGTLVAFRTCS